MAAAWQGRGGEREPLFTTTTYFLKTQTLSLHSNKTRDPIPTVSPCRVHFALVLGNIWTLYGWTLEAPPRTLSAPVLMKPVLLPSVQWDSHTSSPIMIAYPEMADQHFFAGKIDDYNIEKLNSRVT